ncbi:3'(2'),5'-bisphosphate nucleotidase CysQ [Roseibacillus ishigakijimensis]|uniref:3'(2'),5'-bisphosphate nucleotidase CysQ n=1 Tax=Roseibacillus ishigakijimensis TaxID=454146 RepID=A0A934RPC3_9BACT|nr:3'(2'),5'-bisphosphate nucleotidase CysQ [Roseibacillus ishigakijimensis]MBK1833367.1 3'(2'),5'-bisphosphate nucleotidase CysQ [Roseibacillus ishigakijimensis]
MIKTAYGIDVPALLAATKRAGEVILEVYARDFEVEYKGDDSPLTEADQKGNAVLMEFLRGAHPEIPIISEENKTVDYEERRHWERFWLVDPLDGTKEFIKKNGEFTVNVALIEKGVPVLGVVYRPTTGTFHLGVVGEGAWRITGEEEVQLQSQPHYQTLEKVRVVASRSHLTPEVEQFVADLKAAGKEVEFLSAGSSLKLCLVAEGEADVYPRFGPTMEWDTGAAHAVALAAGRQVNSRETGEALAYNKENLLNPYFLVE